MRNTAAAAAGGIERTRTNFHTAGHARYVCRAAAAAVAGRHSASFHRAARKFAPERRLAVSSGVRRRRRAPRPAADGEVKFKLAAPKQPYAVLCFRTMCRRRAAAPCRSHIRPIVADTIRRNVGATCSDCETQSKRFFRRRRSP